MKKQIKLTESELYKLIKESVGMLLSENDEMNQNAIWETINYAKNDVINLRYHARALRRIPVNDPQISPLLDEYVRLTEAYFNIAKEVLGACLEKVDDGWKKTEYQKYLQYDLA